MWLRVDGQFHTARQSASCVAIAAESSERIGRRSNEPGRVKDDDFLQARVEIGGAQLRAIPGQLLIDATVNGDRTFGPQARVAERREDAVKKGGTEPLEDGRRTIAAADVRAQFRASRTEEIGDGAIPDVSRLRRFVSLTRIDGSPSEEFGL